MEGGGNCCYIYINDIVLFGKTVTSKVMQDTLISHPLVALMKTIVVHYLHTSLVICSIQL